MSRTVLRDEQWERISALLAGKPGDCSLIGKHARLFIEALLWIGSTRALWCDFSGDLGTDTIFIRYSHWSKNLRWESIFTVLSHDADFEYLMFDSAIA